MGDEWPRAYFLTWTAYATWLHGDDRGSKDRTANQLGAPSLQPDPSRQDYELRFAAKSPPTLLSARARETVAGAIRGVCTHRGWCLLALNVRSSHVHVVVSCAEPPEQTMRTFKTWATRSLAEANIVPVGARVWTRHGSTRYLWTESDVDDACRYVSDGQ